MAVAQENSGDLSPLESLFFHVTKVLIYKTVSSPLRVTHLLLQSKNVIIEQNEATQSLTKSTINTMKSWLFWTSSNSDITTSDMNNNEYSMIDYIKETNASILHNSSLYSSTNTLNFLYKIINDNKYGMSYLFIGNLYNVIRGLLLHRSAQLCYDSDIIQNTKDKYIGVRYNQGWISWSAHSSSLWFGCCFFIYPLHNIYINYLIDLNSKYKIPQIKLTGIAKLYSGYLMTVWKSIFHCFLYYKLTDIIHKQNRNDLLGNILSKYVCMGLCNIICYPFDTIQKRMMIINENMQISFNNIINTNDSYFSLFDGLYTYLLKTIVSQISIDGFDIIIIWYKNIYKINKLNSIKRDSFEDADLICNICLENKKEYVFNCGHCVCQFCKVTMIEQRKQCHICRANITSVQRMYI